ncbi:MAG: MerR family transcriptional regulator [Candidatus Omnitrophica bacterium]|nr:MerR family transcriptional regulator [Candidatus Omnitrophota bacterium]
MNKDGQFYKIYEVSNITNVSPHILRYWEKEFYFLKPLRDQRGQRIYSEKDIKNIEKIKEMLYNEGYKIKGAKKKLRDNKKNIVKNQPTISFLKKILKDLQEIEKCLQ